MTIWQQQPLFSENLSPLHYMIYKQCIYRKHTIQERKVKLTISDNNKLERSAFFILVPVRYVSV